jgi:hypothetical protein
MGAGAGLGVVVGEALARHCLVKVFIDKYGKLLATLLCVGRCWEKRIRAVLYCARRHTVMARIDAPGE